MTRVNKLPDHVANRIAAGEVVERPASVIKELVENSIDAESSYIKITIDDGGKEFIEIIDDGFGMSMDDLKLAVLRHTTSKISKAEDLDSIFTLGFRGEALPSIGSVARLSITSRQEADEYANYIIIDDGNVIDSGNKGANKGTTIRITNLFDHVPARKKFLKSNQTEFNHIRKTLNGLVLAHYNIGFRLERKDGSEIFDLQPRKNILERILDVFGEELGEKLVPIEYNSELLSLWGFISVPGENRNRSDMQYFILNGRPVKNHIIHTALKNAYGSMLPKGRYPMAFIFFEISPRLVDVNVHPAKYEVRFRREDMIFSSITRSVKEVFSANNLGESISGFSSNREFTDSKYRTQSTHSYSSTKSLKLVSNSNESIPLNLPMKNKSSADWEQEKDLFDDNVKREASSIDIKKQIETLTGDREILPQARFNQLHNLFIITETKDGILLIDQHAAHERIIYEKVLNNFIEDEVPGQRLLFPIVIIISPQQKIILENYGELLSHIGFEFEIGKLEYKVSLTALPSFMKTSSSESDFLDILDEIYSSIGEEYLDRKAALEKVYRYIASSIACKAAIKAGEPLTEPQMSTLFDQLFAANEPYTCPHGRPTVIKLTMSELFKRFGRT